MSCIDILSVLNDIQLLRNIEIYGKVLRQVPKPINLGEQVKAEGHFYVIEVMCVNLSQYEDTLAANGITSVDNTYFVNGSICVFSQDVNVDGWVHVVGDMRIGSRKDLKYVTMLEYIKQGNMWIVSGYDLKPISHVKFWSDTNPCKADMLDSITYDRICRPTSVNSLPRFKGDLDEHLVVQDIVTPKPQEDVSGLVIKQKANLINRQDVLDYSDVAKELESKLKQAENRLDDYLKDLFSVYSDYTYVDKVLERLMTKIGESYKTKQGVYTGRAIIAKHIDLAGSMVNHKYLGSTVKQTLLGLYNEIYDFVFEDAHIGVGGDAWAVVKTVFTDKEYMVASFLSTILGLSMNTMLELKYSCDHYNLSFTKIAFTNPYLFQPLGKISYADMTKIAISVGVFNNPSITKYKNIALIDSYLSDKNDGSTYFINITTKRIGDTLTEAQMRDVSARGTYLYDNTLKAIKYYIGVTPATISPNLYKRCGNSYKHILSSSAVSTALNDYIDSGVGVVYNGSAVMSTLMLRKELYVYDILYDTAIDKLGYSFEEIDTYIDEYEEMMGYKLEPEQRNAVYLLDNGAACLTGSAGSGKTTVINCMVYVLSKLEPNNEFKFATPTGKSAKRLQEVIGIQVKTLCSTFLTTGDMGSVLDNIAKTDKRVSDTTFFIDETAMVTIDLLYSCLVQTSDCRFYFVGDTKQLPPIGKGLPFKNMLRFMPCVSLAVSKRAVEGSNITYNANLINDASDYNNWKELKSGEDFLMGVCPEEELQKATYWLCRHYLGKTTEAQANNMKEFLQLPDLPKIPNLTPDDIQVISPFVKEGYTWGTTQLNKVLQGLFNPVSSQSDIYHHVKGKNTRKFHKGDRVVHSDKNIYTKQWYDTYRDVDGKTVLQVIDGYGVSNGDVGKILGIFSPSNTKINNSLSNKPAGYPKNMQDDTTWSDSFLGVEYWDYISKRKYIILYRMSIDTYYDGEGVGMKGEDLDLLNLFYAGSAHKMQGSQEKLIISVLGDVQYKGFITRNLMYTIYTRGSKLVYALGSVSNSQGSMLSKARRDIAEKDIKTIGELIIPNK